MSAQDDLEQVGIYLSWVPPGHAHAAREHFEHVESRLAHLEEGLRHTVSAIDRYDAVLDPNPPTAEDLLWSIRAVARALLADQDGATKAKELRKAADRAWERGDKELSESLHQQAREIGGAA